MVKPVALAHADQSDFGPKQGERRLAHRSDAPVVPNLECIDVADAPLPDQPIEHGGLGISGEQRGRRAIRDREHHTGIVLGCVSHRPARAHDTRFERPHAKRIANVHLDEFVGETLGDDRGIRPELRARLHHDPLDVHTPLEGRKSTDVVGMLV